MGDKGKTLKKYQDLSEVGTDDGSRFFSATHAEIKQAAVADVYYLKTLHILEAAGLSETEVVADIHTSSDGVLVGVEEAKRLLDGSGVCMKSLPEGETMRSGETVMQLKGSYSDFCLHETALLGMLASSSGWATAARACVEAAGESVPVSCFASRHLHPAVAPVMERAALIGGCSSASNILGASLAGQTPRGTMPHSYILIVGDTLKASRLYLRHLKEAGPLISLVDTFNDEAREAVLQAESLGSELYGVRLDTPQERGGVTPALVREVRARLDQAGASGVKIFVSGGVTPARISELVGAGADAFGVGSYISDAAPVDMTLDLKSIDGRPVAKRGRIPGPVINERFIEIL
jgi:nicotinate phosphoribosyltransferase